MSIAEKLITIAQNEQLVANANTELEDALYSVSDGGASWYDKLWQTLTNNYEKREYGQRFMHMDFGFVDGFRPPKKITPIGSAVNFLYGAKNVGVISANAIDFSECTNFQSAFEQCDVSEIELLDTRNATNLTFMFMWNTATRKVGKLILKDDGSQNVNEYCFSEAYALEEISVEGKFGASISFRGCERLSKKSFESVINALSSAAGGQTITFSKTAKEKAFTSAEWDALISTKPNWTISLV